MRSLIRWFGLLLPRHSAVWVALGTIGGSGLSFLFQGALSLMLTDSAFGAISSAIVTAVGLSIFASFGAQYVMLDFVKRRGTPGRQALLRFIHLWMATYALLLVLGVAVILLRPGAAAEYVFVSGLMLVLALFAILAAGRQSAEDFRGVCLYLVAPEFAKLLAVGVVALLGLRELAAAYLAFGLVFLGMATLALAVPAFWTRWGSFTAYRDLVVVGFPFAAAGLLFMVYYRATLVVFVAFGLREEAGSLAIVYLFMTAILLVPTSYSQRYLLGGWHAIRREDTAGFRARLVRQLGAILLFSAPIALGWLFFSSPLLGLVYGERYALARDYAPWFAIVFLIRAVCIPLQAATSLDEMKWRKTWVVLGAAATTLVLSAALARPLGLPGALVSGIAAELVLALGMSALVWLHLRPTAPAPVSAVAPATVPAASARPVRARRLRGEAR